jgi:hypothetical protein
MWLPGRALPLRCHQTDMLLQNSGTGAFEVYDISHNAVTSMVSLATIGLEWTVAGIAADPPAEPPSGPSGASPGLLVQAMASLGASPADARAPGTVPGGADTSRQTLLSIPH